MTFKQDKEVYICKYEGNVVYVGKGSKNRHQHCTSGCSHVYELNKLHFTSEKGAVTVHVVHNNLTDEDAINIERELILKYNPIFNKHHKCGNYLTTHAIRDKHMKEVVTKMLISQGCKIGSKRYTSYSSRIFATIKNFGWVNLVTGCQVSSASKYSENVRLCINHLVRSNMHQNDIFTNIFTYDKIKTSTYTLKLSEDFVRDIHCSMELKG